MRITSISGVRSMRRAVTAGSDPDPFGLVADAQKVGEASRAAWRSNAG